MKLDTLFTRVLGASSLAFWGNNFPSEQDNLMQGSLSRQISAPRITSDFSISAYLNEPDWQALKNPLVSSPFISMCLQGDVSSLQPSPAYLAVRAMNGMFREAEGVMFSMLLPGISLFSSFLFITLYRFYLYVKDFCLEYQEKMKLAYLALRATIENFYFIILNVTNAIEIIKNTFKDIQKNFDPQAPDNQHILAGLLIAGQYLSYVMVAFETFGILKLLLDLCSLAHSRTLGLFMAIHEMPLGVAQIFAYTAFLSVAWEALPITARLIQLMGTSTTHGIKWAVEKTEEFAANHAAKP